MCGICGVFNLTKAEPIAREVIERMTQTIAHRGPDDSGYLFADGLALGFRRLSIIDLSTGNQPISNENNSVHVICNGEIFDYRELRLELLLKGHQFRSQSDVEVLAHLYEDHGEDLLKKINGQFAFVIFDQARERLFLARDHFGVAPLFYTVVGNTLIFASEIKALLAHPAVERRVDLTGLDQVLSLPGLVSPRTMFAGIKSLPPGHYMTVDRRGSQTRSYWDLVFPPEHANGDGLPECSYREQLEHCLVKSVRRRLQADVPVGSYLSGGLDSSLVTSIMQSNSNSGIATFSITFGDHLINEGDYQRMVADHLGCIHHEIVMDVDSIERRLRKVIYHTECPVKESYDTAAMALSSAARAKGVPVILCGEGADELFAGYLGYRFDAFRQKHGGRGAADPKEMDLRRSLWGDESIFYEKNLAQLEIAKKSLYSPALAPTYDEFAFTRYRIVDPAKVAGIHPLHRRCYLDVKLRLGDHLLGDHGDRMLLANAVEGRFPFLDVEVAELACRMPPDLKLRGYVEKYILKEIAQKYVPRAIVEREKYGFNAFGSPQLLKRGVDWVEDMLSPETIRRQGYFNPDKVEELKKQYQQPDFRLSVPYEDDLLLIVLTFGLFLQAFQMPNLGN